MCFKVREVFFSLLFTLYDNANIMKRNKYEWISVYQIIKLKVQVFALVQIIFLSNWHSLLI